MKNNEINTMKLIGAEYLPLRMTCDGCNCCISNLDARYLTTETRDVTICIIKNIFICKFISGNKGSELKIWKKIIEVNILFLDVVLIIFFVLYVYYDDVMLVAMRYKCNFLIFFC